MPKPVRDTEKARRAARHPDRPGEDCRAPAGTYRPVVDRAHCEGKRDCVDVCPENVFEVRRIDDADFAALGFFAKLKSRAHGRLTAYTPNESACRACGLCVVACPERAIVLETVREEVLESSVLESSLETDRDSHRERSRENRG